ncbi:MAG: DUF742 domain-containing protein [Pseudonocardia sp.]|nr:DUF742 domain-containing protein [Pseudonocardia sp.]
MTTGPNGERRQEPTFADVMNGFGLGSGRPVRRRLFGRRRGGGLGDADPRETARPVGPPAPAVAAAPFDRYGDLASPSGGFPEPGPDAYDVAGAAAAVRPYTWTRGRTKSGFDLAIETLVSTSPRGRAQAATLQVEHRAVAELCEQTRSVAEVAALLSLPLGVARVVLGDMAGLGVVTVHQTASSAGSGPDLALMERVLSGLRRL